MKFEVVRLSQFSGNKAGIYSVCLNDEQITLFECFLRENMTAFKSEIIDINKRIIAINTKTGAREVFKCISNQRITKAIYCPDFYRK